MPLIKVTDLHDGIALVTLSRASKRNAINMGLADDFVQAVEAISARELTSAVLEADGPVFCAGADLTDIEESGKAVTRILDALTSYPLHWTVKVRQPVLGAGLAILAACPSVISTHEAVFGLPELAHGFFPAAMISSVSAMAGPRAAYELAFRTAPISADHALRLGIVSALCSDDDLDASVLTRARTIANANEGGLREGISLWQQHIRPQILH